MTHNLNATLAAAIGLDKAYCIPVTALYGGQHIWHAVTA
jgi:hypothetical protein